MAHTVSNKAYNNGYGFGDQTVYDDVFGGPPKFGVPTLSPRVEDYAEIFGSFHVSRASSIPILVLPAPNDEANFSLDVRSSSHFDYSQVFGGSNSLDYAVSFKELFIQSKNTTFDSSEEAWAPALGEYLSDELDPSACSERSQSLSNGGSSQSFDGIEQFNISFNKASQRSEEDISTQLHAVPGFTCVVNGTPPSQYSGDRDIPFRVTDDLNPSVDFSGRPREGKKFRKTLSHPATSTFGMLPFGTDLKPVTFGRTASCKNETFVTVTDISLRTQPSQLPPPLRSPPVLAVNDGDSDTQKAKFKACRSLSSGGMAGDSSPPFFDVEVDASSSATFSAAAMKDAMEKALTKLTRAKELMERKTEVRQSCTMLNDAKYKKEKTSREIDVSSCFNKKQAHRTCERDCIGMNTFSGEERQKVMKATLVDFDSTKWEKHLNVAKISADKKHGKDKLSEECNKSEASVAWGQAAEYCQLVENDKSRNKIEQAKDDKVLMQNTQFHELGQEKKESATLQEQQDDNKKIRAVREAREWVGGKKERLKATEELSRQVKQEMKFKGYQEGCEQEGNGKKQEKQETELKVYQEGCGQEENGKKRSVAQQKIPAKADKSKECENLAEVKHKEHEVKVERKLKEATERVEDDKTDKDACEREENETLERESYERRFKEATERAEMEKRLKEALDQEGREKQQGEACEREKKEKRPNKSPEREENEKRLKEAIELEENKKRPKEALEQEETEKWQKLASERDENEETLLEDLRQQEIDKKLNGAHQQGENGEKQKEAHEREESKERLYVAYEKEEHDRRLKEGWEEDENKRRLQEAFGREESEKGLKEAFKHKEIEKGPEEANECEETQKGTEVARFSKEFMGHGKDYEQHAKDENGRRLKSDKGTCVNAEVETLKGSNGAVEVVNVLAEEQVNSSLTEEVSRREKNRTRKKYSIESLHLHDSVTESVEAGIGSRQTEMDRNEKASEIASNTDKPNVLTSELGESGFDLKEVELTFEKEETEDKFMSSEVVTELVENGRKMRTDQTTVLEEKRNAQCITQKVSTSQNIGRKGKNLNDVLTPEEKEKEDSIKGDRVLEKDRLRKIEEERERQREREKDRMAVDRAAPEAHERAFVEAHERAERAAVERATAQVRQRVMAEARERLEKASAEARERSLAGKASIEARLRAERAAVERATAEARERAFQKAINEKATFEVRELVERSVANKSSASCNNGGVGQSYSFADMHDVQCQGAPLIGSTDSNSFSSSYSAVHSASSESRRFVEVEGESAQRCKARLERHQRTAERAAKALAEKNMRDLLALKEQAERNRFAEALDVGVKRWSSGKEGNLRALLSTLQYILGPDSGWQPIPLTEVITSAAVKKAYRKATLCVHPDKLQQRGASIQQKYICEKVFDLLKEAWNKFNSVER